MAYYHDRSSPRNPPSLYDTSTSTAEDSYSSASRRHKAVDRDSTMIQDYLHHEPTVYSTPRNRYPRIRKSASEPVQPTGRYLETTTTSAVEDRCDPTALQFMDDFGFDDDQLSNRAAFDPVTKAREVYSPTQARRKSASRNYYGDFRSKFEASRKTSGLDPNESFGSSLDTPSTANSSQGIQRQLWIEKDGIQNGRSNQQQSSPKINLDDTFDSDNTASFKSKYYEAALRGRETTNANSEEVVGRSTTSRPWTKSRGDETNSSALSTPSDEGRRSHSARNYRTALEIPPLLETAAARHSFTRPQQNHQPPLSGSRNQSTNPFEEDRGQQPAYEPTRARSLSRSRDRFNNAQENRTRFPSSDDQRQLPDPKMSPVPQSFRRRDPSVESRGRSQISPLIQTRIREFSQEPRGRSMDRVGLSQRSYSQESRRRGTTMESSFERLAREFGQELEGNPSLNHPTRVPVTNGSENNLPDPTVRRVTVIKDAPNQRSETMDRRPPTPINSLREAPSLDESKSLEDVGPKQHAEVAAYWQEKARSSPTPPMPNTPLATKSRPTDYHHKGQETGPSLDSGSNSVERQVADLVAKLSAVNRSNPAQALAQIDSILRQETRINSIDGLGGLRRPPSALGDTAMNRQASGDSDDETSVSELTNPTFQSAPNLRQDEQRNASQPYANASTQPQHSYVPSTSTFRRPRPSGVQNYIPSHLHQDVATRQIKEQGRNKTKEGRDELNDYLPPSTIKVKEPNDERSTSTPPLPRIQDRIRVTVTQNSDRRTPPSRSPTLEDRVRDTVTRQNAMEIKEQQGTVTSREVKNAAVGDKQILAAKIRDWDEMSNGHKKPTNEGRAGRKSIDKDQEELSHPSPTLPSPTKWNRTHPWDGEIPTRLDKVETRDTSMENAAGVEVALSRLTRSDDEPDDRLSNSLEISRTEQKDSAKPNYFASKVPRDKSLLEVFPDDPTLFTHSKFPDLKDLEGKPTETSQHLRAPVPSRPVTGAQLTPTPLQMPPPSPSRVHGTRVPIPSTTQSMSRAEIQPASRQTPLSPQRMAVNPFSSDAMVAMPYDESLPTMAVPVVSNTWSPLMADDIFPEIPLVPESDAVETRQQPVQRRDGRVRKGPVDTDESFDTIYSSQRPGPASCLPGWKSEINRPVKTVERGAIEVALGPGENGLFDTSADTSTSLEIFGVNQKVENTESGGTKNKRRGFLRAFMRNKDKKKNTNSVSKSESPTQASDSRPVPQIWLQPVLPAFHPDAPPATGRGRNQVRVEDRAPQLLRSASADRFRSPNMAQKFGRMMSLYDKD